MSKQKKSSVNNPKVVKSFSFSGEKGYRALEILENIKSTRSSSGLIIDLLLMYDRARNVFGDDAISVLLHITDKMDKKIRDIDRKLDKNI